MLFSLFLTRTASHSLRRRSSPPREDPKTRRVGGSVAAAAASVNRRSASALPVLSARRSVFPFVHLVCLSVCLSVSHVELVKSSPLAVFVMAAICYWLYSCCGLLLSAPFLLRLCSEAGQRDSEVFGKRWLLGIALLLARSLVVHWGVLCRWSAPSYANDLLGLAWGDQLWGKFACTASYSCSRCVGVPQRRRCRHTQLESE